MTVPALCSRGVAIRRVKKPLVQVRRELHRSTDALLSSRGTYDPSRSTTHLALPVPLPCRHLVQFKTHETLDHHSRAPLMASCCPFHARYVQRRNSANASLTPRTGCCSCLGRTSFTRPTTQSKTARPSRVLNPCANSQNSKTPN